MRPMTRGSRVVVLETEQRGNILGTVRPWGELIVRLDNGSEQLYTPHELEVM